MDKLHKSKADHLLDGLVHKEINKFNKFIINRLDGSGENILKYWEYRLSQKKLTGSFVSTADKGNFSRKVISDFVKIIEKFYALKGFEKDPLSEKAYLIRELRDRQLYKLFSSLLDETKQLHKTNVRKGYTNYLNILRLNLEDYFLFNSRNEDLEMFRTSINMSSTSEGMYIQSKFFEYINMKLYCFGCNVNKDELNSIESIVVYLRKNEDLFKTEYQSVYTLYLIYEMIENYEDESKTIETLNYIKKNYNNLTVNFLQLSYELVIRYYILQVNSGNSKSLSDLYKIFKEIEKKELFKNIQHIQPLNFLSAISVSLAFGDVNFADEFLYKYNAKMNSEYRKQVSVISRAMIDFSKGKYSGVKTLLLNDKTKNISMYIFSKLTLLKALYELNDVRVMIPLIDTVKHYLNRHIQVEGPYKNSIFLFLNFLNSLSTSKRKNGRGADKILDRLNNGKLFFQKNWIVAKAEELKTMSPK